MITNALSFSTPERLFSKGNALRSLRHRGRGELKNFWTLKEAQVDSISQWKQRDFLPQWGRDTE